MPDMNRQDPHSLNHRQLRAEYQDNFSRHVLGVSRYLQEQTMEALRLEFGHQQLRLGFAPYLTLIGSEGVRLTTLSQTLGISRQACNQALNPIQSAGYIERRAVPGDGRAKAVALTEAGQRLRRDGITVLTRLQSNFADVIGEAALADSGRTLSRLHRALLPGRTSGELPTGASTFGTLLPGFADYLTHTLMELTRAKGHPGLKLSFGQVLTLIGPSGGRVQTMARLQDVSKQAISAIASELTALGYLERQSEPGGSHRHALQFTARGLELIADSVASGRTLELDLADASSKAAMGRMKKAFRQLYRALALEQEVFEPTSPAAISELAANLYQQLGEEACAQLARQLLNRGAGA